MVQKAENQWILLPNRAAILSWPNNTSVLESAVSVPQNEITVHSFRTDVLFGQHRGAGTAFIGLGKSNSTLAQVKKEHKVAQTLRTVLGESG